MITFGVYLPKCDLHPSQVVIITKVRARVVDVVDTQLQVLNFLEVIIQSETLTEGRAGVVLQTLSAAQLTQRNTNRILTLQ